MIEQIKVLITEWNWEGISEKLDTQEEKEAVTELVSSCRYLIGEVERLNIAVHIDVSLGNTVAEMNEEIERLRKAQEEQKKTFQAWHDFYVEKCYIAEAKVMKDVIEHLEEE